MAGMVGGGGLTILLLTHVLALPSGTAAWGLDASLYGITLSAALYIGVSLLLPRSKTQKEV
jgi:hypothetical protein